jgi:hypothetical protein
MDKEKRSRGRPEIAPEDRLNARSIRLTPAQWAKINAYGLPWLRKLIDRAKPPKED